ncbi:hypothetical protein ACFYP4_28855 [Streptomyces sp. NPDC005551]|uniref:hypothetical protein n=1 Tax=Streptomyces sp. NPDC005551 TaxID=3364725 RepID=UPI0036A75D74
MWDRLTGTRRPGSSVAPLPPSAVRATLLGLNGPDVPYRVRNASPAEKADLVAECEIRRVGVRLKSRMRLVPDKYEVRVLHERWENRTHTNADKQYGLGHAPAVFKQWGHEQGPDGKRRRTEVFRFDTREMTDPLQDAVLGAGWTWRGVFKL